MSFPISSSTSFSSGNLPNSFLEKIDSPLTDTSKTPPLEGISINFVMLFL